MKTYLALSKFMKKVRADLNLTQSAFAKTFGSSPQFVSNWERGIAPPPMHILKKLAKKNAFTREEVLAAISEDSLVDAQLSVNEIFKVTNGRKRTEQT